ncbi:MAG TPA: hypothetical protein VKZ91_03495 [Woeseiaceae bacterium]|nr:hypothetical protein [Woeseiaceae bacterium]
MREKERKKYCLVDHANKQKDLARLPPYEFWVRQVKRRDSAGPVAAGGKGTARRTRRIKG